MNHYDTLGVSKTASQEDIKNAYKNLVKKYHPDIYPGDKSFAEKKIKEINVAYEILSIPETRKEYDIEINPEYTAPSYNYTPPKYNSPSSYSYENYYRNKNDSDFGDYYKRYTDYHRSKTPNSNYNQGNDFHNTFSNNIINSVDKMSLFNKIMILFVILFIYAIICILTISKFNAFNSGEETGTILNSKKTSESNNISNITNSSIIDTTSEENEFDINDYFTENEIRQVYNEYVKSSEDTTITYAEFKQAISDYILLYMNN